MRLENCISFSTILRPIQKILYKVFEYPIFGVLHIAWHFEPRFMHKAIT